MRLHSFRALRPANGQGRRCGLAPYDVINTEEARARERAPLVLPSCGAARDRSEPGASLYSDEVYETGAANLRRMEESGVLA